LRDLLILSIVVVTLLIVERIYASVSHRQALRNASVIAEQALILADRTQLRQQVILSDVMDRFMAGDFDTYKERQDVEESEGGFEGPEEEEEGGITRPGTFGETPREDDRAAQIAEEEAAILAEDFDESTGEPLRSGA
jgi:hypothetical protein